MKKCVVLFSGGIDSTTALFWAINQYHDAFALTFDYGQRHKVEIQQAKKLAQKLQIPQKIIYLDLKQIGGSSLIDTNLPLPGLKETKRTKNAPPSTYVPFRNGIFLAMATAWSETKGITEIICGFNIIDSPDYPDTREPFVKAMEKAVNLGASYSFHKKKLKIHAPFIDMKKSDIIKIGLSLGADYSYSISCYAGKLKPCFQCSSCLLRQKAWEEVGIKDPLISRLEKEGKI